MGQRKEVRLRHWLWFHFYRIFIQPFFMKQYNLTFKQQRFDQQCIILSNHQSMLDFAYIETLLGRPIYTVATENIFSLGLISKFLSHIQNPIPTAKNLIDASTVFKIMRLVSEGGSFLLFPDGNMSYTGELSQINHTLTRLIRKVKLPLVFVNSVNMIKCAPRWGIYRKRGRKGAAYYHIRSILYYDDYNSISDETLYELIKTNLTVDSFKDNSEVFTGRKPAEGLERLIFLCPKCKTPFATYAKNNKLYCNHCDFEATYNKYGLIEYGAITWTPLEAYHLILNDYIAFLANKLQSSENETLFSDSGRLYYISRYKRKKAGPCFISVTKNEIFLKFKGKTLIIPIEKAAISIEIKSFIKIYLDYKIKDDFSQLLIKFAPTVSILKYFVTKQFLAYYHEGKIDLGDKKSYENLYFGL